RRADRPRRLPCTTVCRSADMNGNGVRDAGDIDLSGVAITLTGVSSANTNTSAGAYNFSGLAGGGYSVAAPSTASGYLLASAASLAATLPARGHRPPLFPS